MHLTLISVWKWQLLQMWHHLKNKWKPAFSIHNLGHPCRQVISISLKQLIKKEKKKEFELLKDYSIEALWPVPINII